MQSLVLALERELSEAMIRGPSMKTMKADVTVAAPVRKVMYLKRLKI